MLEALGTGLLHSRKWKSHNDSIFVFFCLCRDGTVQFVNHASLLSERLLVLFPSI